MGLGSIAKEEEVVLLFFKRGELGVESSSLFYFGRKATRTFQSRVSFPERLSTALDSLSRMQLSMALTARPRANTTTSARASLGGAKSTSTQRATTITLIARSPRLASASAPARRRRPRLASVAAAASSGGDDATGAWLDLASFVTGSSGKKGGPYDELADAIGKAAYVDVQGWHVYLSDVKVGGAPLAGILAGELGPLAAGQGGKALSPATVDEFLARVPLKLGGGKATVSLLDSIPSFALGDLHRAVEDWSRNGGR